LSPVFITVIFLVLISVLYLYFSLPLRGIASQRQAELALRASRAEQARLQGVRQQARLAEARRRALRVIIFYYSLRPQCNKDIGVWFIIIFIKVSYYPSGWIDRSRLGSLVYLIIPGLVVLLVYLFFFMPTVLAEGVEGTFPVLYE
jgi:uncharacterized MAPEG superfamily protein